MEVERAGQAAASRQWLKASVEAEECCLFPGSASYIDKALAAGSLVDGDGGCSTSAGQVWERGEKVALLHARLGETLPNATLLRRLQSAWPVAIIRLHESR